MLFGTESSGKAIGQRNVVKRYFVEIRFLSHVEDVRQVSNRQESIKGKNKTNLTTF